jgi:hypothetical protein
MSSWRSHGVRTADRPRGADRVVDAEPAGPAQPHSPRRCWTSFADALTELEHSDAKVVVIRGAGRAFSAGYDINPDCEEVGESHRRGPVADRNRQAGYIERFTRIWQHPQPVIAAIHGFCMAGASQLACFCDITVVAEDAVIAASPALPLGGGSSLRCGPSASDRYGRRRCPSCPGAGSTDAARWNGGSPIRRSRRPASSPMSVTWRCPPPPPPVLQMKKLAVNRVQEIQGFLTIAGFGADTDALIHTTSDVADIQDLLREVGIKEAIRRFRGPDPDPRTRTMLTAARSPIRSTRLGWPSTGECGTEGWEQVRRAAAVHADVARWSWTGERPPVGVPGAVRGW